VPKTHKKQIGTWGVIQRSTTLRIYKSRIPLSPCAALKWYFFSLPRHTNIYSSCHLFACISSPVASILSINSSLPFLFSSFPFLSFSSFSSSLIFFPPNDMDRYPPNPDAYIFQYMSSRSLLSFKVNIFKIPSTCISCLWVNTHNRGWRPVKEYGIWRIWTGTGVCITNELGHCNITAVLIVWFMINVAGKWETSQPLLTPRCCWPQVLPHLVTFTVGTSTFKGLLDNIFRGFFGLHKKFLP
jgi:hypothetical protein